MCVTSVKSQSMYDRDKRSLMAYLGLFSFSLRRQGPLMCTETNHGYLSVCPILPWLLEFDLKLDNNRSGCMEDDNSLKREVHCI